MADTGQAARGAGAFSRHEWLIAGRYLRARKKERAVSAITGFSLVGIALGVATLIVVMSVMNGFRDELVTRLLGANGHVSVFPPASGFADPDAAAAAFRAAPGIVRAAPLVEGTVLATGARGSDGALLRGLSAEDMASLDLLAAPEMSRGALGDLTSGPDASVALGWGLAQTLGAVIGDEVRITAPSGARTAFGRAPTTTKRYRVAYIFRLGLSEYDKVLIFALRDEAAALLRRAGGADQIEIMVERPVEVKSYRPALAAAAPRGSYFWDWEDKNGAFLAALRSERVVMFIILSLMILVAALNIISGLIMLVKDKGPDIGILRTIGLTRGAILRVFFICGAAIGVVGTVAGVALGIAFTLNLRAIQKGVEWMLGGQVWDSTIRQLTQIPAQLSWFDVGLTSCLALGLSFLATLYPAWRAARLDPIEALRHE